LVSAISPPLRIELAPSRWLRWTVLALAVLAVFAIRFSGLPEAVLFAVPLLASLAWLRLSKPARACFVLYGDGRAVELDQDGSEHTVEARAFHERGPFGVLEIVRGAKTVRVPWAGDTLDADARRRLRLWMRQHAPLASASWFEWMGNSARTRERQAGGGA